MHPDILEKLQAWYMTQCDGEWEHQFGLQIDTLDNPGWTVSIDLAGTDLETVNMKPCKMDAGESDWIFCEIKDRKFIGNGDPGKLKQILEVFLSLVNN
jgi:hypothetical protein